MPRLAANLTTLFGDAPFLERFGRAARAGFSAVEFQFPYDHASEVIAREAAGNGLDVVLFNLALGDAGRGERGLALLPENRDRFRDSVDQGIAYAVALGCRQLHCLAGNVPEGADDADLEAVYVENLRFAAAQAKRHDVRVLIEPLNPFDNSGYFLTLADQAAAIIARAGSDNLFLQYDFYHQSRTRGELVATFDRLRPLISHVQIAGNPGRNEPDTGEVDYGFVLSALDARGYGGFVGCEYFPRGRTEEGLGWARRRLAAAPDREGR